MKELELIVIRMTFVAEGLNLSPFAGQKERLLERASIATGRPASCSYLRVRGAATGTADFDICYDLLEIFFESQF